MRCLLALILSFLFVACQPNANDILERSWNAHRVGVTQDLDALSYAKTTQVYDSLGQISKTIEQEHKIFWDPFVYEIRTPGDTTLQVYRQRENIVEVEQFGATVQDTVLIQKAQNALATAYFVFWQPFKLDDPKAAFSYLGKEVLPNEEEVHVVEVRYPNDPSTDEWAFFFDTESYLNLGYRVRHNGKLSLILNEDFTDREGLPILVYKRSSYLVLETMNALRLQADYKYQID